MLRALACSVVAAGSAVVWLALPASGATDAARCTPSHTDVAGPFQTGVTAPRRSRIGSGHVLRGRVLRAGDCAPVARTLVVLWQSGPRGYSRRGRASVVTDRAGRFRFEGPVPYDYGGRGPHIHIAVVHPAYEELVTRYVVRRGANSGRIRLVLIPLL